jgi:aminoglycoside phosphotransferase (APT) family kinase protein
VKKLRGRTDVEDTLSRLDRLTQEEARMATVECLKLVHRIDDNRQALVEKPSVGEKLHERVQEVDKVQGVDDRVREVDDKVLAIIGGAQLIFNLSLIF